MQRKNVYMQNVPFPGKVTRNEEVKLFGSGVLLKKKE